MRFILLLFYLMFPNGKYLVNQWSRDSGSSNSSSSECSVMSDSLGLMGSFLRPWDFPCTSTRLGCRFLLWAIFLTQRLKLCLLYWQTDSLPLSHQGSPPLVGFYEKESVMNMLSWSPFISCFRKCNQGAGDAWTPGAHLLTPGCVNRPAVNT